MLIMTTSFVILIFDSNFKWVTALTFSSIALIKWFVIGRSFKRLHESKFIVLLPLLDVLYSFLTPLMFYSVDKTDSKKW